MEVNHEKSMDRNDWIHRYALALVARGFTMPIAVGIAESNYREDEEPEDAATEYSGTPFPMDVAVAAMKAVDAFVNTGRDDLSIPIDRIQDGWIDDLKYSHGSQTFFAYWYGSGTPSAEDDELIEAGEILEEDFECQLFFTFKDGVLTKLDESYAGDDLVDITDFMPDIIEEMQKETK